MSNTILSPTIITREALRILHANLNFIGSINRQYDNQFANSGASPSGKIGPTLTIRNPNQFTVRSGATLAVQDVTEQSRPSRFDAEGRGYELHRPGSYSVD
jgi:hypothetical protein